LCEFLFVVRFLLPDAIRFSFPGEQQSESLSVKPGEIPRAELRFVSQFLPRDEMWPLPPDATRFLPEELRGSPVGLHSLPEQPCGLQVGSHSWSGRLCDSPALPRSGLEQPCGFPVELHSLPEQRCGSRAVRQPLEYLPSLRHAPPSLG
jgi:hypothetical protein